MHDSPNRLAPPVLLLSVAALALAGRQAASLSAVADEPPAFAQAGRARQTRPPAKKSLPPVHMPVSKVAAESAAEADEPIKPDQPAPPVEYETITLAGGDKVHVEKWGETCEAYDYRPPVDLNNPRVEEIIWFKNVGGGRGLSGSPDGMQVDSKGRHLYWSHSHGEAYSDGRIIRSSLDGRQVTFLVENLTRPRDLVLDVEHDHMYWLEGGEFHSLKSAKLDGSDVKAIAEGLHRPFGLAIDSRKKELYYWEEPARIIRVRTDGTGSTQILSAKQDDRLRAISRGMFWAPVSSRVILMNGPGRVYSLRPGAESLENVVDAFLPSNYGHFAFSPTRGQFAFPRPGQQISLMNLDGSERETLVTSPRKSNAPPKSVGISVAFDDSGRYLFWSGVHFDATIPRSAIFRMKLPSKPKRTVRPAPPLIIGFNQTSLSPGKSVTVNGKSFSDVKTVSFVDDATYEHVAAKYAVRSPEIIEVSVPQLSKSCSHPLLIIETPSGVTVTLSKQIKTLRMTENYIHDRYKSGRLAEFWVRPYPDVAHGPETTHSVVAEAACLYVERGNVVGAGAYGMNTIFAKNGSHIDVGLQRHSFVYHEPFVGIPDIQNADPTLTLKAVPVIRPSILDTLPKYGD